MPASRVFPTQQIINWDRTGPNPSVSSLSVNIIENFDVEYVQFYIEEGSGGVTWLTSSMLGEYLPTTGGTIPLEFINLDQITAGSHTTYITIFAYNSNGGNSELSSKVVLNITGDPPTQILTDKTTYNVIYNRETNELSGDLSVGINNNTEDILLKFWQNENVFEPSENFVDGFTLSDNMANPIATNPNIPTVGALNLPCKIMKQTGEFVTAFNVNLIIVDGGISVQPESLAYEVFKGPYEKSAVLMVTNPLGINFEIVEKPDWLDLSDESGNTDLEITVTTITTNLSAGIYTGKIKFSYNDDFLEIPVTLNLKSFIVIDEAVDFCLDLPEVLIYRKNETATFVRVTLTANYFVLGIENSWQKIYQVPYFLGVAKFALGEKLHRHFPRAKKHFFDDGELEFMKMISATIKVEELNSNLGILYVETLGNIKLFPGKKPEAFPLLSSAPFRKKNKNAIIFTSEVQAEKVILKKRLENVIPNPLVLGATSINYYYLPKAFSPVDLQWENQNLCPEWFTFTGEYKLTPDFNHIYARNIFNAQNEKYDVSKIKTLTINTGMFLAKERSLISEMIESKISFIKIEGKIYRCFNITKKNNELDSTEEIIARDLEYLIVE